MYLVILVKKKYHIRANTRKRSRRLVRAVAKNLRANTLVKIRWYTTLLITATSYTLPYLWLLDIPNILCNKFHLNLCAFQTHLMRNMCKKKKLCFSAKSIIKVSLLHVFWHDTHESAAFFFFHRKRSVAKIFCLSRVREILFIYIYIKPIMDVLLCHGVPPPFECDKIQRKRKEIR